MMLTRSSRLALPSAGVFSRTGTVRHMSKDADLVRGFEVSYCLSKERGDVC